MKRINTAFEGATLNDPITDLADRLDDLRDGIMNDTIAALHLRGIDDFLQAAYDLTAAVQRTHEDGRYPEFSYRLFLALCSIGHARTALWPSAQSIDGYIADWAATSDAPAYTTVGTRERYAAQQHLAQAMSDLEVASAVIDEALEDIDQAAGMPGGTPDFTARRKAETEKHLLVDARNIIQTARHSIPRPDDNTVPF